MMSADISTSALGFGGGPIRLFRLALCDVARWATELSEMELRGLIYRKILADNLAELDVKAADLGLQRIANLVGATSDLSRAGYAEIDDYLRPCLWTTEEWSRYDSERY